MTQGVVTITCGNRSVSEVLDLAEEQEQFEHAYHPDETLTFEHYTRPVTVLSKDLATLNGNHLLFGYMECLYQADFSPFSWLGYDMYTIQFSRRSSDVSGKDE